MRMAVIPARGGSKRIPRKNIKEFFGKPMIGWSIEAAQKSKCFDLIMVSTDDSEIAEIAQQYGACVPFVRPPSLSDDYTGTTAVVRHAVNWGAQQGLTPEHVCCIYATAPFVEAEDIQRGLQILEVSRADYAFSATNYSFPIQRAIRIMENGRVEMFDPDSFNKRSQDLETAYHDAGQFYWGLVDAWKSGKIIFSSGSMPVLIPRYRVQDIDTPEDWEYAEWIFKAYQLK